MRKILFFVFISFCLNINAGYSTKTDIPYSDKEDVYSKERCRLDVYYCTDTVGMPVIVWFHGGGLTKGNRSIPNELKKSGFVVVAPNYRLMPRVEISGCIDDAAEAVAWTFKNIEKFGGDPRKIFVAGHSAGAYLTSMVGLDRKWLIKYGINADSIAALIPYSGQAITHYEQRKKQGLSALQPVIDEYAPLSHIRKDAPPYIIITGDADLEMNGRYEENAYMWRMMKLIGHPDVKIFKIDGMGHGPMSHPAHYILKRQIKRILSQQ